MNTQLSIKNFRVFDENGVRIDIKPLTILTGCNSSGKSSIVKAAFLLNSFMKQVNEAIENGEKIQLDKYKLDFTGYPNNLLGRFDKVIPEGSESPKITLGYTIHSYLLAKDVDVQLVFAADKNDDLNNAYLVSLSMSTEDGVFYSSDKESGSFYNMNIIEKNFMDYVKIEFLIDNFCDLYNAYTFGFEETVSVEEFETQRDYIFDALRQFERKKVVDVAKYIRTFKRKFSAIGNKAKLGLLDWTKDNGSYFNIPVLKYLSSIKREDLRNTIECELLFDKDNYALLASSQAVVSVSNRIIDDYLKTDFPSFDKYFEAFEHSSFEHIGVNEKECPGIFKAVISSSYLTDFPRGSKVDWDEVSLSFRDNEPCERNQKKEDEDLEKRIKEWENHPINFDILYTVVMVWNEKFTSEESAYYTEGSELSISSKTVINYPDGYHHHVFEMLTAYAFRLVEEMICPTDFKNMSYVSSSRATVKKLYALDEKDDFTELLKRYFEKKQFFQENKPYKYLNSSVFSNYEVNSFMNNWIKQFGIGEELSFKLDDEGLGVKLYLKKGIKPRLLSDEGYGITQLISILLQIETAIISAQGERINNFSGLSAFDKYDTNVFHYEDNTIVIEEPEIHLHPSYQSKLAEMFIEANNKYNIHFIIETHSEYLIRKLQTLVAKKYVEEGDISIQYVYSPNVENRPLYTPQVKSISIKPDGRLTDSFGPGFFDEADNAAMELLTLKEQNL